MFELFKEELNGYQQLTIYVEDPVSVQNVYDKISESREYILILSWADSLL